MPRPIHFEIPADDPARAARFYEKVFGWSFQKWEGPMEYWMVSTGPDGTRGIDGGLMRREQPGASTVNVVDVASVDETTRTVRSAGGTLVAPKMAVPGVGWVAYYMDPEKNVFGVMQEDPSAA
jgi:predicted enzyme related to lactoylglutathione lyase